MYFCFVQTDRAAMLDEIMDYVKFLRLQVKVELFKVQCTLSYRINNRIPITHFSHLFQLLYIQYILKLCYT